MLMESLLMRLVRNLEESMNEIIDEMYMVEDFV